MIDRCRACARRDLRERAEWYEVARSGMNVEEAERIEILLVLRLQLHHHPVLIVWRVDGRDLPRAVCIVERILDGARGDAERGCAIAIDVDGYLRILDL